MAFQHQAVAVGEEVADAAAHKIPELDHMDLGLLVPWVASDVACTLDWAGTVVVAAGHSAAAAVDDASAAVAAVVAAVGTESHPSCTTACQHAAEVASAADTLLEKRDDKDREKMHQRGIVDKAKKFELFLGASSSDRFSFFQKNRFQKSSIQQPL